MPIHAQSALNSATSETLPEPILGRRHPSQGLVDLRRLHRHPGRLEARDQIPEGVARELRVLPRVEDGDRDRPPRFLVDRAVGCWIPGRRPRVAFRSSPVAITSSTFAGSNRVRVHRSGLGLMTLHIYRHSGWQRMVAAIRYLCVTADCCDRNGRVTPSPDGPESCHASLTVFVQHHVTQSTFAGTWIPPRPMAQSERSCHEGQSSIRRIACC